MGWLRTAALLTWQRPPVVRQYDRTDCGPAALLSVLRGWGGDASLAEVRDLACTDARGTTLRGLQRAAHSLGMDARGVSGSLEELAGEPLPCLVHLTLPQGVSHFVVLDRICKDELWVRDPAEGRTRIPRDEFLARWQSGAALLLMPTSELRSNPQPGWLRWMGQHLHDEYAWLVQSVFLGCVGAAIGLGTAIFVQLLIDRFIPERDAGMILVSGLVLMGLLAIRAASGYLRQRILLRLNRRVSVRMNEEFLRHLFRLPLHFFERRATGEITARIADGLRIQQAVLHVVGTCVIDGIIVVGSFVFLFVLVPPLGWIALGTIPLLAIVLFRITSRLEAEEGAAKSAYARVEAAYIDTLGGAREILAFGAAALFVRTNAILYQVLQRRIERLGLTRAGISLVVELTGGALILGALVWGALLVVGDTLELGRLIAGYALLGGMLPSVERLVLSLLVFQEASVAAHRFRDLLLAPEEPSGGSRPFRLEKELRLERARFEWGGGERLLHDLDLSLPLGRVTGLTGPNGAGKSTLLRILGGSLPLTSGRLLVDGLPSDEFSLAEFRRNVGILPRNVRMFSGTLGENVLLGRTDANTRQVLGRLGDSGLTRLLEALPDGWSTRVGEGGHRLSAGERQAAGLVRVLLGEPRILLVDEGITSADGEVSEILLEAVIRHALRGAVLIVSHDPSILLRVEHLCVLERGRIVRAGHPEDILAGHWVAP